MKVIIRTDASVQIGSGHVMRCLTVAKNLKKEGCTVKFWMKELPGNLIKLILDDGFENISTLEHADLFIIDHYQIDIKWESEIRNYANKIMVIDDLANRQHDCDILLDQNVVPNYNNRYDSLVPETCIKLLGPKYLIMRDEFIKARKNVLPRGKNIKRLLVFMGGSDPTNETMKVLKALEKLDFPYIDVVVGNSNTNKVNILDICKQRGYHYHCQIDYIADLMQKADFSVGAGGSTTWERCYLGLPSSSTIVAENQIVATNYAEKLGAVVNLGHYETVSEITYKNLLTNLYNLDLHKLSQIGRKITDTNEPNLWVKKILEVLT